MPTNPNDPTVLSGAALTSGSAVRSVTRLGRYTLRQRLGVGGMAEVYLADQDGPQQFHKKVVVKRILPSLAADASFVAMFVREAQVAARLSHGNVVQIYELGEQRDDVEGTTEYFIAMEYIDGLTLQRLATASWNAGRAVPVDVVVRTMADAARGLHAAHTLVGDDGKLLNLVHRDISPDNLMVSRDGVTKVLDFGIAKGDLGGPKTRTGNLRGKIPYMSPEQITGQELDGRCDLWALGVSTYWLLCGERPFDRQTDFHTMQSVLYDQPKAPTELNPAVPKKLEQLILSLLQKDRNARPGNGSVVADELEEFAAAGTGAGRRSTVSFVAQHLSEQAGQGNPLSEHGEQTANTRPISPHTESVQGTALNENVGVPPMARPEPLPASAQRIALADVEAHKPDSQKPGPRIVTLPANDPVPQAAEAVLAPASVVAVKPAAPAPNLTPATAQGANHPVVDMLSPPSSGVPVALIVVGVLLVLLAAGAVATYFVVQAMEHKHQKLAVSEVVDAGVQAASHDAGMVAPIQTAPVHDGGTAVDVVVDAGAIVADAGIDAGTVVVAAVPVAPTRLSVRARAPQRVVWILRDGTEVGRGTGTLSLPLNTMDLIANDPERKVSFTVSITAKSVDFASLPTGTLVIKPAPGVSVFLYKDPIADGPITVPAATYALRFTKANKFLSMKSVVVAPGATVTVDAAKP